MKPLALSLRAIPVLAAAAMIRRATEQQASMLSRRDLTLVLASATFAPVRASAAPSDKPVFTLYTMRTVWHPIPAIGDWPLDHVALTTSNGTQWECFGRTQAQEPSAKAIAHAPGDELWAKAIAGPDGTAGIDFGVTGICHHCANRIALSADIDSRDAPGNEIATPIFGRYGLDRATLATRVKDAARLVNKEHPNRISEKRIAGVVARIGGGLKDEWATVRSDIEQFIKPALGSDYNLLKGDIEHVYLSFFHKREALYSAYLRKSIDRNRFIARMNSGFTMALEDLKDVVGNDRFGKIVPVPPKLAADYLFYQLPEQFR